MNSRDLILQTVEDLAEDFLRKDREIDVELPAGAIEAAVLRWDVTIGEIALRFEEKLRELIPVPVDEPGAHTGQAGHVVRSRRIHDEVGKLPE